MLQTRCSLTSWSHAADILFVNTKTVLFKITQQQKTLNGLHNSYGPKYVTELTSLHLTLSLVDRWGTKDDWATTFLRSSLFSAFRRASPNFKPVHSVTLSSLLFFCLPILLPPCTVPCRIMFASPVDLVMCPFHLSLRFSQWWEDLHRAQWLAWFCSSLPHL